MSSLKDQRQRLRTMMQRCLGNEVFALFANEDVTEIYINPQEGLFRLDTHSKGQYLSDLELGAGAVRQFLNAVATYIDVEFGGANPVLEAELPEEDFCGSRLEGFCPPVTTGPALVIRKPPTVVYPLSSYVENGFMSAEQQEAIREGVRAHDNILVVGGTNSGKTTLTNAIIKEITDQFPTQRLVILEDTRELQCAAEDHLILTTANGHKLSHLVKYTLRCTPDRIIVGECRDETALDMMDAWSTGHPGGVCTLHASSTPGALARLDRLSQRANVPPQPELVGEAVDLIVRIEGGNQGRLVPEVARVHGYDGTDYHYESLATLTHEKANR